MTAVAELGHTAVGRLDGLLGGPARRQVVLAFACVLALDSADKATIGASATQLESGLGISKTQIGLLLTASSFAGALATIPFGILVDRVTRVRLLGFAVAAWGVAMLLSGVATGYLFLLLSRIAMGAVLAVAAPAIASLVGDYFPSRERGRIYGFILSGELIGAGFGFVVSGQFAVLSWRAPFLFLMLPSAAVWWVLHHLPEPARDGASQIAPGDERIRPRGEVDPADPSPGDQQDADAFTGVLAHEQARASGIEPNQGAVLRSEPQDLSLRQAVRYVLSVRTNVVLILASALGYFFFSGLRGFAVQFAKQHYSVSQSGATSLTLVLGIGALIGVLSGGRLADRLLRHGRLSGRIEVPGVAVLVAGALFVPALLVTAVWAAVPLLFTAALFLGAANPPLDAARLDIIHPAVWGRAESIRTVLRNCGDATAPLLFGVFADSIFAGSNALEYTFLLMLGTLFIAAVITLVFGRRAYPGDVAAAAESTDRASTLRGGK